MRIIFLIYLGLILPFWGYAQIATYVYPLKNQPLLSGSFAELRATHFHSGIDFRTGGVEELPVHCINEGRLARVSVSSGGYGNALYVAHPDGTTSVYAHLQKFSPAIARWVRRRQYATKSFTLDCDMRDTTFIFKKDEIIGVSGNTGSSGGPHLHFEVRKTASQQPINPLHYFSIVDTQAPQIKEVLLYAIQKGDIPFLYHRYDSIPGNSLQNDTVYLPTGKLGIGLHIVDKMNQSTNKLGLYHLEVWANGEQIFNYRADTLDFAKTRYINALKSYDDYSDNKTTYLCFGERQQQINGLLVKDNGYITLNDTLPTEISIVVNDINGNTTRCSFYALQEGVLQEPVGEYLVVDKPHHIIKDDFSLILPDGALFYSIPYQMMTYKESNLPFNTIILTSKPTPLLRDAELTIRGDFESNTVLCKKNSSGKFVYTPSRVNNNSITAKISELGVYTVLKDTLSPKVIFEGKIANNRIAFHISDDLSGISKYKCTINNKWTLFAFDAKTGLLYADLNEPTIKKNFSNKISITVTDNVGNQTQKEYAYRYETK